MKHPVSISPGTAALFAAPAIARRCDLVLPKVKSTLRAMIRQPVIRIGRLLLFAPIGLAGAAETVFPGGTLASLKAQSSTLVFDILTLTGNLDLAAGDSVTLKVNHLNITATGGVSYSYSDCTYRPAADFTVEATGRVIVNGNISLIGRSGTRTLSSSSCTQAGGQRGGNVRITADEITLTGNIRNYGGAGGTSVLDSSCSSGVSGGAAGGIFLSGRNVTLDTSALQTSGGTGGSGTCYGSSNQGSRGAAGAVVLTAANLFTMRQSTVSTDGTVTLTAAKTDICGPITGGTLQATVGGNSDRQGPQVQILAPLANSVLALGQPFQVRIRAEDLGTGVKNLQVDGLGYSHLHSAEEMVDGVLTVSIAKVIAPATLKVTAQDNQGNSATATVTGLDFAGNLSIPEGETLTLVDDLNFGPEVSITVGGTLLLKRGAKRRITAGSIRLTATGIIKDEDPAPYTSLTKAPSLEIVVWGSAAVAGTIDLSGHKPSSDYSSGEAGGDLTIKATDISVTGTLKANGGYSERSYGGIGGTISLAASATFEISRYLSASGGGSNFSRGGNGGTIYLYYVTLPNLVYAPYWSVAGGSGWTGSGTAGKAYLVGPASPGVAPTIDTQPIAAKSVTIGASAMFGVLANGTAPLSYQWRKDGTAIPGATTATYTIASAQSGDTGSYSVVVRNLAGSVTSNSSALTVSPPNPPRLVNLSILTSIDSSGDSFTMGYVVGGVGTTGGKALVVRAAGPSLGALGVSDTLDDPKIELFAGSTKTGENDNWGGSAALSNAMLGVGAFAYAGPTSRDACAAFSVTTRDNSVKVAAAGAGTGTVIAEIYDATPTGGFTSTTPRLVNVSVLKSLGAGFTVGFVVGGNGSKKVLVRAIGPTLASAFGVSGAASDPQVKLFSGQTQIGENDNWGGTTQLTSAFNAVGAFLLPANSKDAALVATLQPGQYTAQISGVGGTTGIAIVEVYEVPDSI